MLSLKMALIVIYISSLLLILIGIEPLKAVGIILSISYLPGFCLFTLVKSEKIEFEDLILVFPCSIGISSILIFGLLFLNISIHYIPTIIYILTGFAVVFYIITRSVNKPYIHIEVTKSEIIFCLFALLITLLLTIPVLIAPNGEATSSHGFLHSSLVAQVLNGIFPPENPGLGGTSIGYYWGFHTFIAALTTQTHFHQFHIMFVLNVVSFFMVFCISYSFTKLFGLSEGFRYIMPFAVIGLMRSDAGIFFIAKLLSGNLMPVEIMTLSPTPPSDFLETWFKGVPWYDPRMLFLHKLYNVSGMLSGINLCLAYFMILLLLLRKKLTDNKIYLVSISNVIIACVLIYPPLAIIPLLHAPIWVSFIFLSQRHSLKEKGREALQILSPYIIAMLLVSPYLLFIMKNGSAGQGRTLSLDLYAQSIKNLIVFWMPIPVIISGIWIAIKRFAFSRELYFLLISTLLCFILSVFARLPFDNSYKFNYILVFFFALYFVFALAHWAPLLANRWYKHFIAAGIIIFFLLNSLIIGASYIVSFFPDAYQYTFSSGHLMYVKDKLKNEAYEWIRKNTPPEALIMLGFTETNMPCCGFNNNYITAAFAERNLYVIKDKDFTMRNPEYKKRIWFREELFQNPEDPAVIDYFTSLNRPVYLLLDENFPDGRFKIEDRFKKFPENPGERFLMVFHNKKQRIYRINY